MEIIRGAVMGVHGYGEAALPEKVGHARGPHGSREEYIAAQVGTVIYSGNDAVHFRYHIGIESHIDAIGGEALQGEEAFSPVVESQWIVDGKGIGTAALLGMGRYNIYLVLLGKNFRQGLKPPGSEAVIIGKQNSHISVLLLLSIL
jgi:hypothetical protein